MFFTFTEIIHVPILEGSYPYKREKGISKRQCFCTSKLILLIQGKGFLRNPVANLTYDALGKIQLESGQTNKY